MLQIHAIVKGTGTNIWATPCQALKGTLKKAVGVITIIMNSIERCRGCKVINTALWEPMQHSVGTHTSVVVWLRALMGLEMEMRERDGTRRVPRLCCGLLLLH